jgi:hypothetical protein
MVSRSVGSSRCYHGALALIVLCLAGATAARAQEGKAIRGFQKPAWKWTPEERLAKRFDPEAMRARAEARATKQRAMAEKFPSMAADFPKGWFEGKGPSNQQTIEGDKTPELFMPSELFTFLIDDGFPPDGRDQSELRLGIEERAAAIGFGRDLWNRIEKAATPYLKLQREHFRRAMANPSRASEVESDELSDAQIRLCRVRTKALAQVKAELGEEAFLRLLYEAVAPAKHVTYVLSESSPEHVRFQEGGCL